MSPWPRVRVSRTSLRVPRAAFGPVRRGAAPCAAFVAARFDLAASCGGHSPVMRQSLPRLRVTQRRAAGPVAAFGHRRLARLPGPKSRAGGGVRPRHRRTVGSRSSHGQRTKCGSVGQPRARSTSPSRHCRPLHRKHRASSGRVSFHVKPKEGRQSPQAGLSSPCGRHPQLTSFVHTVAEFSTRGPPPGQATGSTRRF